MRFLIYVLCMANLSSCFAKDEVEKPIVPKTETPREVVKEMKELLDAEKRIINVYHSVVGSVVNVSNIRVSTTSFMEKLKCPKDRDQDLSGTARAISLRTFTLCKVETILL